MIGDADVLTKRRQSTGKKVHYFIGPIRDTLEEAEADRKRWESGEDCARCKHECPDRRTGGCMLVRQAVTFIYQGHPTGPYTKLGAALANALLRDYAYALGIEQYESNTDYRESDYARISYCAMEWQVPDTEFERLNTIGEHGNRAFKFMPAIGKCRPALRDEILENREIVVRLEELVRSAGLGLWARTEKTQPE